MKSIDGMFAILVNADDMDSVMTCTPDADDIRSMNMTLNQAPSTSMALATLSQSHDVGALCALRWIMLSTWHHGIIISPNDINTRATPESIVAAIRDILDYGLDFGGEELYDAAMMIS